MAAHNQLQVFKSIISSGCALNGCNGMTIPLHRTPCPHCPYAVHLKLAFIASVLVATRQLPSLEPVYIASASLAHSLKVVSIARAPLAPIRSFGGVVCQVSIATCRVHSAVNASDMQVPAAMPRTSRWRIRSDARGAALPRHQHHDARSRDTGSRCTTDVNFKLEVSSSSNILLHVPAASQPHPSEGPF
eukprot:363461-Chlamydomonas_euryale.AAC.5